MYEGGWGKKLNYVIAVSMKEWVDVTPRYTLNKMMTQMRRTLVPEDWLAQILSNQREILWEVQGPDMVKALKDRFAREQAELSK
jgi:peptide-N4-(N-acetyl-beta-glucosaminyl)asparagine amidase